MDRFDRTRRLVGEEALEKLKNARVALFGLGGVGGAAGEALIRAGVGHLTIVDSDEVHASNLNRQILATEDSLGMKKTAAAAERFGKINPEAEVEPIELFYLPDNSEMIGLSGFDAVLDAVDTVTAKIEIASRCSEAGVPLISAMGTGNKLDPTRLRISPVEETRVCPLARVMRRELKKRGISGVMAVWSDEEPLTPSPAAIDENEKPRRDTPASAPFVPNAAGLAMASWAVRKIIEKA